MPANAPQEAAPPPRAAPRGHSGDGSGARNAPLPVLAPPEPARAPGAGTSRRTSGPGGDAESSQSAGSQGIHDVNLAVSRPTYRFQTEAPEPTSRVWYYVWAMTSVNFICILIPLGVYLLPYSPTLAGRRPTDGKDSQTLAPESDDDGSMNLTEQQYCTRTFSPDLARTPRLAPGDNYEFDLSPNNTKLQFRQLFCVFSAKYYRLKQPYHMKYMPLAFCSAIIFQELIVTGAMVERKRPFMDQDYLDTLRMFYLGNRLLHKEHPVPVYLGVGGDRQDSAHFSRALRNRSFLARLANDLVNRIRIQEFTKGAYIDWDRPRGRCGHNTDTEHLRIFLEALNKRGLTRLMLALPPQHKYAQDYDLSAVLPFLEHVVVKTHTLMSARNVVACHGTRAMAGPVLRQFRADFPQDWRKFIYSVSVASYTYTTDVWPQLGASSKGSSVFDRPVRQKGRTTYDQVCKLHVVPQTTDPECAVAYRRYKTNSDFKVAAFTGPQQLWQRMVKSYDDNMGDTPIVLHDMDLDDFLDRCSIGTMSPLAEALAVGVF